MRKEAIAFVLASMLDGRALTTGTDFIALSNSKVYRFDRISHHMISDSYCIQKFQSKGGFKAFQIWLPHWIHADGG